MNTHPLPPLPDGVVPNNIYYGARYVPVFDGEWDATKTYEPLTIVQYQGNSYTSRTYVPAGVTPDTTDYWAETGSYNAQVEQYRQEVLAYAKEVEKKPDYNPNPSQVYNYYVSTTGDDTAAGTLTAPFKTIQHAFDVITGLVAQPGEYIIHVSAGTYTESLLIQGITPKTGSVKVQAENAILDGGNSLYRGITIRESHNISFYGLTVQNFTNSCVFIRESVIIEFHSCSIIGKPDKFGYHVIDHSTYFIHGGSITGCDHGISEYFHVLRSVMSNDIDGHLVISNCHIGLFTKELCTGHFNDVTITGCNIAFHATRNSTANLARTTFKNCTYGAVLTNGSEAWLGSTKISSVSHPWIADYSSAAATNESGIFNADSVNYPRGSRILACMADNTSITPSPDIITNICTLPYGFMQTAGLSFKTTVVMYVAQPPADSFTISLKVGSYGPTDVTIPANTTNLKLDFIYFKQPTGTTVITELITNTTPLTTTHGIRSSWNNYNNAPISLKTNLTVPVVVEYVEVSTTDTPVTTIPSVFPWPPEIQ